MFPERLDAGPASLRRFSADHVDPFDLYELFREGADGVEEALAYVPQEPYATPKDACDELADAEAAWDDGEVAQYAVDAPDGDLAGHAGLMLDWDCRSARLGCILARPFWGEGYALAAATALTELAFDRLNLELLTGRSAPRSVSEVSLLSVAPTSLSLSVTKTGTTGRRGS